MRLTEQDVERVRMAVAEAGYPHESITLDDDRLGMLFDSPPVPAEVFYKARLVVGCPPRHCTACYYRWPHLGDDWDEREARCLGPGLDCGADRS